MFSHKIKQKRGAKPIPVYLRLIPLGPPLASFLIRNNFSDQPAITFLHLLFFHLSLRQRTVHIANLSLNFYLSISITHHITRFLLLPLLQITHSLRANRLLRREFPVLRRPYIGDWISGEIPSLPLLRRNRRLRPQRLCFNLYVSVSIAHNISRFLGHLPLLWTRPGGHSQRRRSG